LYLTEKKKRKDIRSKQDRMDLLVHCLERISRNKQEELKVLLEQTELIDTDLKRAKVLWQV
jgi:hypothetical protein